VQNSLVEYIDISMRSRSGLIYHQLLAFSEELIEGRLLLLNLQEFKIDEVFIARSGLPKFQSESNLITLGKGCIPAQNMVDIENYCVVTKPVKSYNPGIMGNFYPIIPYDVLVNGKVKRGDFGIHFDANVPGSSGCIVIKNNPAWVVFQKIMSDFESDNILQLPLLISYLR
jgi:hypothetical protein